MTSHAHVQKLIEYYKTPYLFRPHGFKERKLWEDLLNQNTTHSITVSRYIHKYFTSSLTDHVRTSTGAETFSVEQFYLPEPAYVETWMAEIKSFSEQVENRYPSQTPEQLACVLSHNPDDILKASFLAEALVEKISSDNCVSNTMKPKSATVFSMDIQRIMHSSVTVHTSRKPLVYDRCFVKTFTPESRMDSSSSCHDNLLLIPVTFNKIVAVLPERYLSLDSFFNTEVSDEYIADLYSNSSETVQSGGLSFTIPER